MAEPGGGKGWRSLGLQGVERWSRVERMAQHPASKPSRAGGSGVGNASPAVPGTACPLAVGTCLTPRRSLAGYL